MWRGQKGWQGVTVRGLGDDTEHFRHIFVFFPKHQMRILSQISWAPSWLIMLFSCEDAKSGIDFQAQVSCLLCHPPPGVLTETVPHAPHPRTPLNTFPSHTLCHYYLTRIIRHCTVSLGIFSLQARGWLLTAVPTSETFCQADYVIFLSDSHPLKNLSLTHFSLFISILLFLLHL